MTQVRTIDEAENVVQRQAEEYVRKTYGMPKSAVRVILWPTTKHAYRITGGPTAVVSIGVDLFTTGEGSVRVNPEFNKTLTRALDLCATKKAWQRMELESMADIERRNEGRRKVLREKYNFDEELVPLGIKQADLSVTHVQRIELVHRPSGIREVVEYRDGNYYAYLELAKARLGRRVAESIMNRDTPWDLPDTHPEWVARTN